MISYKSKKGRIVLQILSGFAIVTEPAQAGIVVDGTRVVYPSGKRDVSVGLRNVGDLPSLVQIWVDAGDVKDRPGETDAPFVVTPPLFRLDPTKGQTLRLIYTQAPLATDRETVFWLNVLDIPPRKTASPDSPNRLEMAFRHRLKLFFRPTSLRGSADDAAAAITWSYATHGGQPVLEAHNPTPYYISLASAEVSADGMSLSARTEMLPPFATQQFAVSNPHARPASGITVKYSFVNDFGAIVSGEAAAHLLP